MGRTIFEFTCPPTTPHNPINRYRCCQIGCREKGRLETRDWSVNRQSLISNLHFAALRQFNHEDGALVWGTLGRNTAVMGVNQLAGNG